MVKYLIGIAAGSAGASACVAFGIYAVRVNDGLLALACSFGVTWFGAIALLAAGHIITKGGNK
jgi:hypothetical protein